MCVVRRWNIVIMMAHFGFSEGGEKFAALEKNKNVSLVIFDKYQGFGNLKGMQVTGKAVMPKYFSEEYVRAAELRKIPISALKKLPYPMNLIKIIPDKIEFTNSEFPKTGERICYARNNGTNQGNILAYR